VHAHVPRRRCVGCGCIAPKGELLRLAVAEMGTPPTRKRTAVLDRAAIMPGRGAYLCPAADGLPVPACLELATRRGGLARTLHCAVKLDL
jgi:predicted RNA-binding protein YlxR (DUF448 family)